MTAPDQLDAALSVGETVLGSLIDESHTLHPDEILQTVRRKAALLGLADVGILLADLDQRDLNSLDGTERFSIEGSMAGRAFQRSEVVVVGDADRADAVGWFPILDGISRIGIMTARLETHDDATIARARQLAGLVAHLVVTKRPFSDAIERVVHTTEPSLAAQLRWSTVPPLAFKQEGVVTLGAMLQPAYEVAGDTFDYAVDRDSLHLAIFDAMGHGLEASQMATLAVFAYRDARRRGVDLTEIARSIDEAVAQIYTDAFVTAHFGILDIASGRLRCFNAGHPRPLVIRNRTAVHEIDVKANLPIGLGGGVAELSEICLQPGDTVVYFSDGVTEARSADGEEFGVQRLSDLLVRSAAAQLSTPETARRITHAVVDHHHGEVRDDATVVMFTWRGPHWA